MPSKQDIKEWRLINDFRMRTEPAYRMTGLWMDKLLDQVEAEPEDIFASLTGMAAS